MSMKNRPKHGVKTGRIHLPHAVASSILTSPQVQSLATTSVNAQQSVFNVDGAFKTIEKIRRDVVTHHDRYLLQGRKAMLEIMSQVYQQFQNAKNSNEFDKFMGLVRNGLTKSEIIYSPTSAESSLLIKYLFADLSYKQTHVYSRALDEAYRRSIAPSKFKEFIEENNGFDGVRQSVAVSAVNAATTHSKKLLEAFTEIDNSPTVATIDIECNSDEKYRVYVAVLNEDGRIDLKDSKLNKKHIDETILRIRSSADKIKNPSKNTKLNSAVLVALKSELATAEADKKHLKKQLQTAMDEGDALRSENIQIAIFKAEARVKGFKLEVTELRKNEKLTEE